MTSAATTIRINICKDNDEWTMFWTLDDKPTSLSKVIACSDVDDAIRQGEALFAWNNSTGTPFHTPQHYLSVGKSIRDVFLNPLGLEFLTLQDAEQIRFLLSSNEPAILNLPWEILNLDSADGLSLPIGCSNRWRILRVPQYPPIARFKKKIDSRLRVLFVAAAPRDQKALNYEHEEEAMLVATAGLSNSLEILPFSESGQFDELIQLVTKYQPDIVHVCGHGEVFEGEGRFAFEKSCGCCTDWRSIHELAEHFTTNGVTCVFMNGCNTARASTAGICQALTTKGIPLALGWGANVLDSQATIFAQQFYHHLAAGHSLDVAVSLSRKYLWNTLRKRKGEHEAVASTFALPMLYWSGIADLAVCKVESNSHSTTIIDSNQTSTSVTSSFVGRRAVIKRLITRLRERRAQLVFVHGLGGSGKTSLARAVQTRIEKTGLLVKWINVPQSASPADSGWKVLSDITREIDSIRGKRSESSLNEMDKEVLSEQIGERHSFISKHSHYSLLIVDDFHLTFALGTRTIEEPGLTDLLKRLLDSDIGESVRILILSRSLPDGIVSNHDNFEAIAMHDMSFADTNRYLDLLPTYTTLQSGERKTLDEEQNPKLLLAHYAILGGNPGYLLHLATWFANCSNASIDEVLIDPYSHGSEFRDEWLEYLNTTLNLSTITNALTSATQRLLGMLSISKIPLPSSEVAQLAGVGENELEHIITPAMLNGLIVPIELDLTSFLFRIPAYLRPYFEEWIDIKDKTFAHELVASALIRQFDDQKNWYLGRVDCQGASTFEYYLTSLMHHAHYSSDSAIKQRAFLICATYADHMGTENQKKQALKWFQDELPKSAKNAECLLVAASLYVDQGETILGRQYALDVLRLAAEEATTGERQQAIAVLSIASGGSSETDLNAMATMVEYAKGEAKDNLVSLIARGQQFLRSNNIEGAREAFCNAQNLAKNLSGAFSVQLGEAIVNLNKSMAEEQAGSDAKSLTLLDSAIEIFASAEHKDLWAVALLGRADLLLKLGKEHEAKNSALQAFEMIGRSKRDTHKLATFRVLDRVHRALNEWEIANIYYQEAIILERPDIKKTRQGSTSSQRDQDLLMNNYWVRLADVDPIGASVVLETLLSNAERGLTHAAYAGKPKGVAVLGSEPAFWSAISKAYHKRKMIEKSLECAARAYWADAERPLSSQSAAIVDHILVLLLEGKSDAKQFSSMAKAVSIMAAIKKQLGELDSAVESISSFMHHLEWQCIMDDNLFAMFKQGQLPTSSIQDGEAELSKDRGKSAIASVTTASEQWLACVFTSRSQLTMSTLPSNKHIIGTPGKGCVSTMIFWLIMVSAIGLAVFLS